MPPLRAVLLLVFGAVLGACQRAPEQAPMPSLDWRTSPLDLNLRGMNGSRYLFRCPPGKPAPGSVTGSGLYTDASSICGAAVHAGAIDARQGGVVMIQILTGQPDYHGSMQNFVRSSDDVHPWSGSFAVLTEHAFESGTQP